MTLDGDRLERYLRAVRVHIDALSESVDEALANVVPEEHREEVRARWQAEVDQPIQRVAVLSGTGGPRPWFAAWDPAQGYHWLRLRAYLLDKKGRSESDLASLDDSSDKVLSHIEDPRPEGPEAFRICGLVLGYVQSGKTANITALLAKAADLGYKLVVVLSGMDDGLRQQTQKRLNRELGLVNDPKGVGLPEHGRRWISLTTADLKGDFDPGSVDSNVLQGNERAIAVIKKNKFILEKLIEWVDGAPQTLPVLVIDDEADQASINTGGNRPILDPDDEEPPPDDEDPSTINRLIRELLSKFNRVSYVAYTATPFANVLIPPEVVDREVMEDLYPKDFIIPLPRPPHYVGAERLFGRAAFGEEAEGVEGLDVVNIIPPEQIGALVPARGRARGFVPQMCDSLNQAIEDFILATAAKEHRLGPGIATMLIHTSQSTEQQNIMGPLVEDCLARLRQSWRYDRGSVRPQLMERWNEDFRPLTRSLNAALDVPFEVIEAEIDTLFRDSPDVRVLNFRSEDTLDYDQDPTLKVVVVGGNKLSRGLTLEDLLVSYYVRNAANYDTLLQMGRWFGYREEFVDLTRLWTTLDLYQRFRHLALVEEEFRDEVEVYERNRLTPLDFGPRIRTHPGMAITSASKMGTGGAVTLSFVGQLRQTSRFWLDDTDWLQHNLDATRDFLKSLGPRNGGDDPSPEWSDVSSEAIVGFLRSYRSAQDPASFDSQTMAQYISEQVTHGELVRWHVAVRARRTHSEQLGTEDLGIEGIDGVSAISRSRLKNDRNSVGVITDPATSEGNRRKGDEVVGLTDDQIDRARHLFRQGVFRRLGVALRQERAPDEGLLLIYPISRFSKAGTDDRDDLFDDPDKGCTVVGLALVFPPSQSAAAVTYIAGEAGRRDGDVEGD